MFRNMFFYLENYQSIIYLSYTLNYTFFLYYHALAAVSIFIQLDIQNIRSKAQFFSHCIHFVQYINPLTIFFKKQNKNTETLHIYASVMNEG